MYVLSPNYYFTLTFSLLSVQAVLMMYNKSVQSFDHAISLSQDLDWVKTSPLEPSWLVDNQSTKTSTVRLDPKTAQRILNSILREE